MYVLRYMNRNRRTEMFLNFSMYFPIKIKRSKAFHEMKLQTKMNVIYILGETTPFQQINLERKNQWENNLQLLGNISVKKQKRSSIQSSRV